MKAVNKRAAAVLDRLMAEIPDGQGNVKIDTTDGAFMPVHVERLETYCVGTAYSVAHYYTQNGDLMSDPRMEFLRSGGGDWYPTYFEQHGGFPLAQESVLFDSRQVVSYRPRMQRDQAVFAGQWMQNIRHQQHALFDREAATCHAK
jgi:hypothetical protein